MEAIKQIKSSSNTRWDEQETNIMILILKDNLQVSMLQKILPKRNFRSIKTKANRLGYETKRKKSNKKIVYFVLKKEKQVGDIKTTGFRRTIRSSSIPVVLECLSNKPSAIISYIDSTKKVYKYLLNKFYTYMRTA